MPLFFETLTADQVQALSSEQTVIFFPVGVLEDHGPHLPMGLDVTEARQLAILAAERLEREKPGWSGVIMPPVPLGTEGNTTALAITVRGHVLRDWLVDACLSLHRAGFRHFACFSGSLAPSQLTAIEEAGKFLRRKTGSGVLLRLFKGRSRIPTLVSASSVVPNRKQVISSLFFANPEDHGGQRDTSIALALSPDFIKPIYSSLPERRRHASGWEVLIRRITRRQKGYWGDPAQATAEQGFSSLNDILDQVFPKLRAVWEGAHPDGLFRSWYSLIPTNQSFFKAWVLFFLLVLILGFWAYLSLQSMSPVSP